MIVIRGLGRYHFIDSINKMNGRGTNYQHFEVARFKYYYDQQKWLADT
jgi:hypothetical protein